MRVLVAALLSIGIGATGCGGGTPVEPVVWAGAFCGGLVQVVNAAEVDQRAADAQGRQEALVQMADSLQESLDDAGAQLDSLGPPAVPEGERTQEVVLEFYASAASTTGEQGERVAGLDPAAADFDRRLDGLATAGSLQALSEQVRQVTANPELAAAFRDAGECRAMREAAR